ncbi:hypothetical protein ACFFJN_19505 [Erwinia mallotivora]
MMKRTLLSILFGACSLFALSQGAAVAGVEKKRQRLAADARQLASESQ